jgi:hypothetical protein
MIGLGVFFAALWLPLVAAVLVRAIRARRRPRIFTASLRTDA